MSLSLAEPLADLLRVTSVEQIAKDIMVISHLLALALGIGTVLRTDWSILTGLARPFTQADYDRVHAAHKVIARALWALWITGFGLFMLKTGGDPAAVSPKLMAKLATVTMLTVTAMMMFDLGMPVLQRQIGTRLVDFAAKPRTGLAVLAGLSMAGWGTALLLGAAATTQLASWAPLAALLTLTHSAGVVVTVTAAMVAPVLFSSPMAGLRIVSIPDAPTPAE